MSLDEQILEDMSWERHTEFEGLFGVDLETAAVLSYVAPTQVPAADLKARLFDRLSGSASEQELEQTPSSDLFELLSEPIETLKQASEALRWGPMGDVAGFEMATWKIDRAYNYIALFLRAKTKANFPLHYHSQEESLLVLAGDLKVEERVYRVGDRIHSHPSTRHALKTQTGCLVLVIASGQDVQPA